MKIKSVKSDGIPSCKFDNNLYSHICSNKHNRKQEEENS